LLIYVSVDRTLVLWQIERGGAEERREIAREKGESARERRGEKANGVVGRRDPLLFEQSPGAEGVQGFGLRKLWS
jgi:hypothetical protein